MINYLGMAEWVVDNVAESDTDIRVYAHVAERPKVCPRCGVKGGRFESRGIRQSEFMDEPRGLKRVGIEATVRGYRCLECGKRFTEALPGIDARRRATCRLVEYVAEKSFHRPFRRVAEDTGLSEKVVRAIFTEAAESRAEGRIVKPAPSVLGVDEVQVSGARRFVVANLNSKPVTLLEMLENRKKETVQAYFASMPWEHDIDVVAMDMWRPYRDAVRTVWPKARIVVDKFHVLQEASHVVEAVRKAAVAGSDAHGGLRLGPGQKILRKRPGRMSDDEREWLLRMREWFPEVAIAFDLKEELYGIYEAKDVAEAERRMEEWSRNAPRQLHPFFGKLQGRLVRWRTEILTYFDVGVTNAGTEYLNGFIRMTNGLAKGLSFRTLRAKVLYGSRQHRPAYWSNAAKAELLPHGMGFETNASGSPGADYVTAGTDLERLVLEMKERIGTWEDPSLWRD